MFCRWDWMKIIRDSKLSAAQMQPIPISCSCCSPVIANRNQLKATADPILHTTDCFPLLLLFLPAKLGDLVLVVGGNVICEEENMGKTDYRWHNLLTLDPTSCFGSLTCRYLWLFWLSLTNTLKKMWTRYSSVGIYNLLAVVDPTSCPS